MRRAASRPAVEPRLIEALCLYDWPFNVRELVTLVRRVMVLHGHEPQLGRRHLPTRFRVDVDVDVGKGDPVALGAARHPDAVAIATSVWVGIRVGVGLGRRGQGGRSRR